MAISILAKVRSMKARGPVLVIRWVQLSMAVVTLILAIFVMNWYTVETRGMRSPDAVNMMIFTPAWSIFSVVGIMVINAYIPLLQHPIARMVPEVLNVVFNFVAFVLLATFLTGLSYCHGSVCGAARATVFFAAVEWLLWTSTAFLVAKECFFNKSGGAGWRRGGSARAAVVGPAAETKEMPTA